MSHCLRGLISFSDMISLTFSIHCFSRIIEMGFSRSNPWCSDCNGKCTQSQGPRVSACDNRDTWRLGLVGVPSPSLSLSATCDRKCVDHRQAAQLALGNQICATWTLEGVGLLGASKHQLQQRGGGPVMCFKGRWVRAGWRPTALALLAIDIHLTAAAAGLLGSAASCCPGPRFRAAIPDSHPQPRQ